VHAVVLADSWQAIVVHGVEDADGIGLVGQVGPPKSRAGRRVVGIPSVILLDVREHLAVFTGPAPGALVFPGPKGGPLRRGNFNGQANWPQAVAAIGASGLHFHDLRHTGNAWAAASGAGLRDLMARMGHDSERAAIIYQHQARGADTAITRAIDAHADAELRRDDGDGGAADGLAPVG
jgi:integrase